VSNTKTKYKINTFKKSSNLNTVIENIKTNCWYGFSKKSPADLNARDFLN
jgi:hypothetical protein